MTNRQLTILAIAAAVLIALTGLLYSGGAPQPGFRSGVLLIQGLAPENVGSIVIEKDSSTVTLSRQGQGFVVADKAGYPASVKEINDLLIKVLDIRCARKVTDSAANHGELGVVEGGAEAVAVSFRDAEGNPLIGFIKGKSAEQGSGAYVRLSGEDTVYLTDGYLWFDTAAMDYVDKDLVTVQADEVERVDVSVGEDSYALVRGEDDKAQLQQVPEGKRAKASELTYVFEALSNFSMDDVARAGSVEGLQWDGVYKCLFKDGLTYVIQSAEKDEKYYVKLSAIGPAQDRVTVTRTESDEELEKKDALLRAGDRAREFTPQHAPWVYEVSSWRAKKLRKPLDELVEDLPKDETPDEVAASHILIGYEGAERSEAERTKEEARELAREVLEKAKAEGADFAALARQYSDGPTGERGGDLGTFGKGQMAKAFEEAAFKLEVGEISDVVETPFGFHVIKRTE